jgi:hypothetical protein
VGSSRYNKARGQCATQMPPGGNAPLLLSYGRISIINRVRREAAPLGGSVTHVFVTSGRYVI